MRPPPPSRVRERLAAGPVDSRWWYWVAALPLSVGLWLVTVAWVAFGLAVGPVADARPLAQAVELSMVAFGLPFLVLTLVQPAALLADAAAIAAATDWRPDRRRLLTVGLPGPLLAVALVGAALLEADPVATPLLGVLSGTLLATPGAGWYLLARHRRLGVP